MTNARTSGQSRRQVIVAATTLVAASQAGAATRGLRPPASHDIADKLEVADLVQRERAARDAGQWDEMAACWDLGGTIDVSWYKGDSAGFIAGSRRNAASGRISVHHLAPTVVQVRGYRAIAETPCELVSFVSVDGVDVCITGVVRLLWRAALQDHKWSISGLRMIYIRDYMTACDPTNVPPIDRNELAQYRPSYRYLSYVLARSPNRPRDDLPGVDRPEMVAAIRQSQSEWLNRIAPS